MCAVRAWESLSSPPAAMLGLGLARRQSSIFLFEMGGEDAVDCVKHRLEALAHAGQAQAYEEPAAGKAVIELRPSGRRRQGVAVLEFEEKAWPHVYGQEALGIGCEERSEEHTSELESLMSIAYAVC